MVLVRRLQFRRAAAAVAEDDLGDLPRALGLQLRHDVQHGPGQPEVSTGRAPPITAHLASLSLAAVLTPCSSSVRTTSTLPQSAASCSAVPREVRTLISIPVASSSATTCSQSEVRMWSRDPLPCPNWLIPHGARSCWPGAAGCGCRACRHTPCTEI